MLTPNEIENIAERLAVRAHAQKVIVFGSYAKGTATIRSDLDVMLVKETDLPMDRRADDLLALRSSLLIPIDVHIYTPAEISEYVLEENSFVNTVLTSGVIAYEAFHNGARRC